MDGHNTVGFHVPADSAPGRASSTDMKIWADAETRLPVRVDLDVTSKGTRTHIVLHDFVYNPQLDEKLFSLQVPPGYSLEEFSSPAVSGPPKMEDLLVGLSQFADKAGGSFPPTMERTESAFAAGAQAGQAVGLLTRHMSAGSGARPSREQMQKLIQVATDLGRAMKFVNGLPSDSGWHYDSSGVRLGDADKALCWWRPAGSETYTVVYGDLSTRQSTRPPRPAP